MATNTGQIMPPLQSQQFTDASGRLTIIALQMLQSVINAVTGCQASIVSLQAAVGAIPSFPTPSSPSYANDAAAAVGGVAVGHLYRNGSIIQMRIS